MGSHVDVSVIVPCYNTQRFLDQALTSAELNGRRSLEVIVLNDGSTDGSLRIMRGHATRDPRVRVVDKPNEGYGATVNRGIELAQGTYVAILEPDDWVRAGAYDDLFDLACATGTPDVVKSSYWRIISNGTSDETRAHGYLYHRVRNVGTRIRLEDEPQLIQYHPSIWSCLYRTEFLREHGIRMLEVPGAGWVDNPFCVHTLAAAKSVVYTDEPYYCYREDLASASSAHASAQLMVDRWHDREDVLDALDVADKGIRTANCIVGLRFLSQILSLCKDEPLPDCCTSMARRMDPQLVASVACIAPHVVDRCLGLAGSDLHAPPAHRYKAHLAHEAWWALVNNGPAFLAHNLKLARGR